MIAISATVHIWLEGLLRAFFSGMAGVLGVIALDPDDFNLNDGFGKTCLVALIIGGIQVVQYLSQKPLPDPGNPGGPPATDTPFTLLKKGTGETDASGPPTT
jgi:hypothetical protein